MPSPRSPAVFPEIVDWRIVSGKNSNATMPPPLSVAELLAMVEFVIVTPVSTLPER